MNLVLLFLILLNLLYFFALDFCKLDHHFHVVLNLSIIVGINSTFLYPYTHKLRRMAQFNINFTFLACRFCTVAYLQQIWWLEVDGEVDFPFPPGTYSLSFRLQLGRASKRFYRRVCNSEHVHGWDTKPVRFQLWTSDGQHSTSQYFLNEPGKWINYHVGNFVIEKPSASTKIKFSMTQIDCTHTKGGLCLDSVLIHPIQYVERLKHF